MQALSFQDMILRLSAFWGAKGCAILQPLDVPMGAATFHPATFLRALGPRPWYAAFPQGCRRPADGRYGENPNRLQHYYQYQVVLKPAPEAIQTWYVDSLCALGIDPAVSDLRFVEDNWESPSLGAWGLGWEVWLDGMEVSQFTYFQQVGGRLCEPVTGELTYGLERLALFLQEKESVYDLIYTAGSEVAPPVLYGDLFLENEKQFSRYHFECADVSYLREAFHQREQEALALMHQSLLLPAYEAVLWASHAFNVLDARGAFSATERQHYLLRVQGLAKKIAQLWEQAETTSEAEMAIAIQDKGPSHAV